MSSWWAASYAVLWLLVIALCVIVVALARQIGTLHLRLGPRGALELDDEGPPLGEAPEASDATDLNGVTVTVGGPGQSQLLLFTSPGCLVCEQVLPSLGAVAAAASMQPRVVTDADRHETLNAYRDKRLDVPIVPAPRIAQRYDIPGTPYVVVLDDLGVVRAKGTVNNLEQLEGLIDTATRRTREIADKQAS